MISYNQIPANLRTPGVFTEIDSTRALSGVQLIRYKILLLGQKLAGGTAAALALVLVTSIAQARALFGSGSMLAIMFEAAFTANDNSPIWCMPMVDAGSGVAAAGSVTFSGAPTAAGSVRMYVGGRVVSVSITTATTAATAATALAAAINADTSLPVTAAVDGGVPARVNITARNAGEGGNSIDLRLNYYGETTPAGLGVTIVAMVSGATNPDITNAIANLDDEWFQVIAMPYTDAASLTLLEGELASRFGPMREIEGHAFAAARGSVGTLATLGDGRNSPHLTIVAAQSEPMPTWAKAAETAAIAAAYASVDPARPLQTLPYRYCLPPEPSARFTRSERNVLLFDGISTTRVDDGGVMRIERIVTTYQTNAAGGPDAAYLDVETMFTLMLLRHDWGDTIRAKYPRHKIADDGTLYGAGQAVVTPNVVKAELVSKFREWESMGLVENFDQYKAAMVVERNASDPNRMDVILPPNLVNGLRILATQLSFRL